MIYFIVVYCYVAMLQYNNIAIQMESHVTLDLSLIFNETGYIDTKIHEWIKRLNYNIQNIKNISLRQSIDSPIKIGDNFLCDFTQLISIDTSQLINVIGIGKFFLWNCPHLAKFNTEGLSTVITIDDDFLYWCLNLINFDTSKLTSLTHIGNNFIDYCDKLDSFDTTGLTSLVAIGDNFLSKCSNLVSFNTNGLISLTTIGNNFLSGCSNLVSFDTTTLINLTSIGNNFIDYYNDSKNPNVIYLHPCNENLIVTIKKSSDHLYKNLINTNYTIVYLYDKPCIHLDNNCVI